MPSLTTQEIVDYRTLGPLTVAGRRRGLTPIVRVTKTLLALAPSDAQEAVIADYRTGPGAIRLRFRTSSADDINTANRLSLSLDDGITFGPDVALPDDTVVYPGPVTTDESGWPTTWDATAGRAVGFWQRQITGGDSRLHDWTFLVVSSNYGLSWGTPLPLTYEGYTPFDPLLPTANYDNNEATAGDNIIRLRSGRLYLPVGGCSDPADPSNLSRTTKLGAMAFTAHWTGSTYAFQASNRIGIPITTSSRGLSEALAAELRNEKVLNLYRASNTGAAVAAPAVRYYSIATVGSDGSIVLTAPAEFTYSDGGRLFSPASGAQFIRHLGTGKLYVVGNFISANTTGNVPRFPLSIGEVDEALYGVKRETMTVIDDRMPGTDPLGIQYSGVNLINVYGSNDWHLSLANLGYDAAHPDKGNAYLYTLKFLEAP
jgi:hypothetical protein